MTEQLRGILTALAVPFAADGGVDYQRLRDVVEGPDGALYVGTSRVPVIAQTGSTSTAEAIALSRHAEAAGADVIMTIAPYYDALPLDETVRYFRAVAGSVSIPVMLYNIPSVTGVNLEPETVGRLAREVENIKYVKNTSADAAQTAQLIHHFGDVVSTFAGWDTLILSSLVEGAAGVMAGTANVIPAQLVSVYDAVAAGRLDVARSEWDRIYPLLDAIISSPFVPAVKAALAADGFPIGEPREPVTPLDAAAAARIAELLAQAKAAPAPTSGVAR